MPAGWVLIAEGRTGQREVTQLKKQSADVQSRLSVNGWTCVLPGLSSPQPRIFLLMMMVTNSEYFVSYPAVLQTILYGLCNTGLQWPFLQGDAFFLYQRCFV